jgi:hypothetical protein
VQIWAAHVGIANVVVVTVPPRGSEPGLLAQRFFGVLGVSSADQLVPRELAQNQSLGIHSVELLRRLQHRLDDDQRERLHLIVKYILARRVLADRAPSEPPLIMTTAEVEWARAQATAMAEELRTSGVRVIGDLDELSPQRDGDDAVAISSEDEVLAAAVDALIGMADAADELARHAGPDKYGDIVRAVGGRGRGQP